MRRTLVLALVLSASLVHAEGPPAEFIFPDPYFQVGDGARGVGLMAIERWSDARDALAAFQKSAEAPKDAAGQARLRYLIATCDQRLARWPDAAAGFDAAAADLPLLGDYAHYWAAVSYYNARDFVRARAHAEAVTRDAVLWAESKLVVADVLRAEEKWGDVATQYRAYLKDHPSGVRLAEARFWLATAEEKLGRAEAALPLYREILVNAPLSPWAEKARPRVDAIAQTLPKKQRAAATGFTSAELITRGRVYFDAMRNPQSEADFAAALADPRLDAEQRCVAAYHRAQSVFKQRDRKRSAPYFDDAIAACEKSKNRDLLVRSLYQGGRAYSSRAEHKKAVALFAQAESYGEHSFADDARLRQSEQWGYLEELGEPDAGTRIVELLSTLPEKYPDGDMKGEALWRLAWRAWQAKDAAGALAWLDKQNAAVPHEENYYAEGQAHYWRGRALDVLGKPGPAREAYRAAVLEYPLSYYALLALNRLRERGALDPVLKELRALPAGWSKDKAAWTFAPRPVYGEAGYARAVELLRLGLGNEAERELGRVGLRVPDGRKKVTDPDRSEQLWATALLYDHARRYEKSHWIARWSTLDYKSTWPTEATRSKWDIAYPRGWWHILEPAAKAQGYPTELLIAFVREESAFDPVLESFANAIGLTQMIFPTANRFGKGLGFEPITRDTLRDPDKNVAIGSRWLGFLWNTFKQHPGLIVAGYNAGEGAAWRWLCERGGLAYDEFGEAIPFDETRNYTKRVLSSYLAYSYLGDGTIPVVSNEIPRDAVNEKKCGGGVRKAVEGPDKPDRPGAP